MKNTLIHVIKKLTCELTVRLRATRNLVRVAGYSADIYV